MRMFKNRLLICATMLAGMLAWTNPSQAQQAGSYVTPFPDKGTYKIYVFGDSLGDGIWSGLFGAFRRDADIRLVNKSKAGTGFVREHVYDWNLVAAKIAKAEKIDIAIAMFGVSDRRAVRIKGRTYSIGSKEWRVEYGRRVDRFIKILKQKNIALYWVGLPIMKSASANRVMQIINQIVREKVYLNGVKYIDTWNGFTDQDGGYSQSGPDLAGRVTRLRMYDGVHFTSAGYSKLGHYVEREIKRDISVAKAERSIPLAGDFDEQRRIVVRKKVRRVEPLRALSQQNGAVPTRAVQTARILPRRRSVGREYGADHSKITMKRSPANGEGEDKVFKILRPAIPPAVVNHILRRVSSLKASNVGEVVTGPMDGGLIAMSSITPVSRQLGGAEKRNVPITQTPYYRVLIKGVVLPSKPGRADDFMWRQSSDKPSG